MRSAPLAGLAALVSCASATAFQDTPSIRTTATVLDGDPPGIVVEHVQPGETVRLHVLRRLEKWKNDGGNWARVPESLHSWADFVASASGTVEVDRTAPVSGAYSGVDPLALLRNGYASGDAALNRVVALDGQDAKSHDPSRVLVGLERAGAIIASAEFRVVGEADGLLFEDVATPGLHGVFARPAGSEAFPVVISLHGSEGGSTSKAHQRAAQFASRGFATLAVNYFAYPYEGIEGVPTEHANIPVETIAAARDWLKAKGGVDLNRLALYGTSKGAEFALVAAAQYDWIDSVVAVVPSDVVWQGYGEGNPALPEASSWSIGGVPVPFVSLFGFDPTKQGCTEPTRSDIRVRGRFTRIRWNVLGSRSRTQARGSSCWPPTATRSGPRETWLEALSSG